MEYSMTIHGTVSEQFRLLDFSGSLICIRLNLY